MMDDLEYMDRAAASSFARQLEWATLVTQVENDDADGNLMSSWVFANTSIEVDADLVPYFNAINEAALALIHTCERAR